MWKNIKYITFRNDKTGKRQDVNKREVVGKDNGKWLNNDYV